MKMKWTRPCGSSFKNLLNNTRDTPTTEQNNHVESISNGWLNRTEPNWTRGLNTLGSNQSEQKQLWTNLKPWKLTMTGKWEQKKLCQTQKTRTKPKTEHTCGNYVCGYLIRKRKVSFCSVWFLLPAHFNRIHNVKQDDTLKPYKYLWFLNWGVFSAMLWQHSRANKYTTDVSTHKNWTFLH